MTRLRIALARTLRRIDNARYLVVGSDDLCAWMNRAVIWLYSGLPVYVEPPRTAPPAEYAPSAKCELSGEDRT